MARQAHRLQHVRRLERARRARGSGRHRDPFEIERDQQRLGFDALEADVGRVRHARARATRSRRYSAPTTRMPLSSRSRSADRRGARHPSSSSRAEPRTPMPIIARDILGSRPPVALLLAAAEKGRQAHAALRPQRADALRAVELVRRDATSSRRPAPARSPESCPRSAPRRCERARRARARSSRAPQSAESCRFRCWHA